MCGICGKFEYERMSPLEGETIHKMNQTMVHRGPEDGTIWVLLNGEIYNYPELRQSLLQRGHVFRTQSDTEAIVHLYEEIGEDCFAQLRGMFSIALWDSRNRKLVLARDRVGKKPLFYAADDKQISFASELKALLAADSTPRDMDVEALSDYFSFGYIPAPKTIYRAVRKVLPGHYLVASAKGIRQASYWDLSFANTGEHSIEEWGEQIRHE